MSNYQPRTEAPDTSNAYYYADNPFYKSGWGMPNCTCYAFGRMWELTGVYPQLSTGNAENWWGYNDGYSRGTSPKLGAVICWRKGEVGNSEDGAGHVAVVEEINADGSFLTSNSGWGGPLFWTQTIGADCALDGYVFQGFIYCPLEFNLEWISRNGYLSTSEQQNNARIIYSYLTGKGWTRNAIAALLGNMEVESTINPGIWESLTADPESYEEINGRYPGYGLVQWTPYTKFSEWAGSAWKTNHNKQLDRLIYEMENGLQYYPTTSYPETFKEWAVSTKSAYYLAGAFLYNYERPAEPDAEDRGNRAVKWFDFLAGVVPTPGYDFPPIWLLFKIGGLRI